MADTDITPSYLDEEDMKHFRCVYKEACDRHDPEYYPKTSKFWIAEALAESSSTT
jgi:coproporphyrinogen III oxidase